MKLMMMEDEIHAYLIDVIADFVRGGGVSLGNLEIMAQLHHAIKKAQDIDFSKLGKMTLDKIGSDGISMGLDLSNQQSDDKTETDRIRCETGGPLPYDSGHPDQPLMTVEHRGPGC
jgi:hypothetical protein